MWLLYIAEANFSDVLYTSVQWEPLSVVLAMATPGVGPPPYQHHPVFLPAYRPQPSIPDTSHSFLEIDRERMDILVKDYEGKIGVLYSERNPLFKQLANGIVGYYSTTYNFTDATIINYEDPGWLDASVFYSHLIFVGYPQTKKRPARRGKTSSLDSYSREEELMSRENRKLSTVVVINPTPRSKPEKKGHFLERFFHIQSGDLPRLAQTAFAVFSGTPHTSLLAKANLYMYMCVLESGNAKQSPPLERTVPFILKRLLGDYSLP